MIFSLEREKRSDHGVETLIISGDKSMILRTFRSKNLVLLNLDGEVLRLLIIELIPMLWHEFVKMPVPLLRVACLCPEELHGIACVPHL